MKIYQLTQGEQQKNEEDYVRILELQMTEGSYFRTPTKEEMDSLERLQPGGKWNDSYQ